MSLLQQIAFLGLLAVAGFFLYKRGRFIARNIGLGRKMSPVENAGERLQKTMLLAFGQKKLFDKPIVGLLHFAVYAGFMLINIEVLEIVLDGLTGHHRLFSGVLPASIYNAFISAFEILALLVVLACVAFLFRRNVTKVERFHKPEMKGWATKDANIILVWEILLMGALFHMNAADSILQGRAEAASHYPLVGSFAVSSVLVPLYSSLSTTALIVMERFSWWIHIAGILSFAVYITYSKHLHIFLAFPNTYYSNMGSAGKMENMEAVTNEVKIMLGQAEDSGEQAEVGRFGAKDVTDLSQKNLMDAYSCTECGRCTANCPANLTGKLLSPRKIMMDTRDRVEELGKGIDANGADFNDEKALYGDYVSKEELMACTTCNACVEACPVSISPVDIILQMRRYVAMEESDTPASWNAMFANMENNFAPWAFPPTDRFKWAEDLDNGES